MTPKKRLKFLVLALAGCFTVVAPALVEARDISLPKYSKDAQLAAFQTAAEIDPLSQFNDDDPLTEILSINEVDVWGRIRHGFAIPDLSNPLVQNHENYYLKKPEYFARTTKRGSKYLFHIVQELEKRGMPTELALLPFIESAYNPHARSIAKAEGLWQFIPSTGRHYDLAQNAFRDERRDILQSTDAALTYLQRLYNMFGDWQLALASYNWGEGSVMRAIKKAERAGKPITFNSISAYMPAETRNYVPKLQAVKNIIAHADQYGVKLPAVENQPYFVTIGKTRDIDVKVAAKLAEMTLDDFRALNPQFGPYVIAGGNEVKILLPKENAEKFRKNLDKWPHPLSSWTAYQVTGTREKVEDIAAKFNTSPDIIRHANNIPARTNLKFGSAILVPKTAGFNQDIAPELVNSARIAWEQDAPATRLVSVPVRKKANVASIAKRYRVSVAQLKSWNSIKGDSIPKGTILKVHVPSRSASGKAVRAGTVSAVRGSSRASRVKVVMDKQERTSSKKGLVKSRNARSAKSVSTKKQAKPVKAQASAKKTTAKKRSSSKKKA
ncbi:transglycosylase SLT domain-containing protein [Oxalobacter formigenes]|uniref:transglycosylase SLT domain-containing protein n=1 Tax=Oxalobacter formigenes TaxID=847 RepID=UPI0002F56A95|nr:transglycosylase SLT domain-containing protein [Oxalobacter formigenes]ARQ45622.1 Membrane-bound lytic murein transglycosylase D [Oxalobacter formigenes]ARQ77869.1 lytic transglycosylase [Oxalobacter formigenes OXCC13]MCZ4062054.1 transglycosylase SLT domain-containing protein [Oxalobacter formigenes]QDX33586.1 LysM peptidoglycan-binding domain-containing protein [Oxalobacter formigenes]WAW04609.1 transglycosylase SLT domain-containing protein [Oxalobacter formigenes]